LSLTKRPDIVFTYHKNYGGDIAPFLHHISIIKEPLFIKLHTKKSVLGNNNQINWRYVCYHDLIGSEQIVAQNIKDIQKSNAGLLCNSNFLFDAQELAHSNKIKKLSQILHLNYDAVKNKPFPAGTMFMGKTQIFKKYFTKAKINKIQKLLKLESGKVNEDSVSTYCHSLERIFGYIISAYKKQIIHPQHTVVKVINKKSDTGYFELIVMNNNECYIKDYINTYGRILETHDKYILIQWLHLDGPNFQKYQFLDDNTIIQNDHYYWELSSSTNEILKNSMPEDFDYMQYLKYNPDLIAGGAISEHACIMHYGFFGYKENRIYSDSVIRNKLPINFNPKIYKILNLDLSDLSDEEASKHYVFHGVAEHRRYTTNVSDEKILKAYNITYDKKYDKYRNRCVVFINHETSATGAPIFLKTFVQDILDKKLFENVVFIDAHPSQDFDPIDNCLWLYHFNDKDKLYKILQQLNPILIYSNSTNIYVKNIHDMQPFLHKTVFHFHETFEDLKNFVDYSNKNKFDGFLSFIENNQKYFPAQAIIDDIQYYNKTDNIELFPPYISSKKTKKILQNNRVQSGKNKKITVGMCGIISERKNFTLFKHIAENNQNINFVWIGDDKNTFIENKPKNLLIIPQTNNPYKELNKLDYFFLTSKSDPCPIVVLESLLLNKKIIVLDNNIKYDHSDQDLENYLVIKNHNNNPDIILKKFNQLKLNNRKNSTLKNQKYILHNFNKPRILQKPAQNKTDNILLSFFANTNYEFDSNYFVNLINQKLLFSEKRSYNVTIAITGDDKTLISKAKKELSKIHSDCIFIDRPNVGRDIGGLLDMYKLLIENKSINKNSYILYIHNKYNLIWREELVKIMYNNYYYKYNTTISNNFFIDCDANDMNRQRMKTDKIMCKIYNKNFQYIGGTMFITQFNNLKPLYDNYNYFYNNLTTIDKNDTFWTNAMINKSVFDEIYHSTSGHCLCKQMDYSSRDTVISNGIKNSIELETGYNKLGIQDLQYEHALERYIGYLISHQKKTLTV